MRWLEARVQDLEDSRELAWGALVAPLYDRVHRLEAQISGDAPDVLDACLKGPGAGSLPPGRIDADWILQQHFLRVLAFTAGNLAEAATLLDVSEKTAHNWKRRWEIDPAVYRQPTRQGPTIDSSPNTSFTDSQKPKATNSDLKPRT